MTRLNFSFSSSSSSSVSKVHFESEVAKNGEERTFQQLLPTTSVVKENGKKMNSCDLKLKRLKIFFHNCNWDLTLTVASFRLARPSHFKQFNLQNKSHFVVFKIWENKDKDTLIYNKPAPVQRQVRSASATFFQVFCLCIYFMITLWQQKEQTFKGKSIIFIL